ncbi:MAG: hypothetical protein ACOY4K_01815 [Pseudomonadota bacterium]
MKKLVIGFSLIGAALVVGLAVWWWTDVRWRPRTLTRHQAEIARTLDEAGWVSPGLTGPKVYVVTFRTCPNCIRAKAQLLPALQDAGVDTRVIVFARRDRNGLAQSTPAERATVAELWINRRWALMEQWDAAPLEGWTAPGLPPADGDAARTAVVGASQTMVDRLEPLLKANGVAFATPLLVWWTRDGDMKACACGDPLSWRFVKRDLTGP